MLLTIEEVKSAFSDWRLIRKNQEQIPEQLLNKVKQLYPHHKKSKICKELHLSGSQLKKIISSSTKEAVITKAGIPQDGFIEATLPALSWCELCITGKTKVLTLKVPAEQLPYVLPLMVVQL
jgi:hypothetical protein